MSTITKIVPVVPLTVREIIRQAFDRNATTIPEFAALIGMGSPLAWQMFIDGRVKLPISHVLPLCARTGLDPAFVLRVLLSDYYPYLLSLMDGLGEMPVLTANERRMIESLRNVTAGTDAEVVVADGRDLIAVVMV